MYLKIHVNSVSFIIFKMVILVTFVQNVWSPWFGPKKACGLCGIPKSRFYISSVEHTNVFWNVSALNKTLLRYGLSLSSRSELPKLRSLLGLHLNLKDRPLPEQPPLTFSHTLKVGNNDINTNFVFPYICSFLHYYERSSILKCQNVL